MCGIIGVAGNLTAVDEQIFRELLLADVVRGRHATGIAQVKGQCTNVSHFKLAMPSTFFLELPIVNDYLKGFINNTVAIGHNRHATKGAADSHAGAHPFRHGHITLVHNGSLTSHYNITPQGESYTVDSEAICRAIEVNGAASVIPKLNGAFALVWVDSELQTLNFVRNNERRLGIVMNTAANKMWWASELEMALWSLKRGEDLFARNPQVFDRAFELEAGKWVQIPITKTGIDLKAMTVTDVVVHEPYAYQRAYQPQRTPPATTAPAKVEKVTKHEFTPTRENQLKKSTSELIMERGKSSALVRAFVSALDSDVTMAELDERIVVSDLTFAPYVDKSNFGAIYGTMVESPNCKVTIHNCTEFEYNNILKAHGSTVTGYLKGFIVPELTELGRITSVDKISKDTLRKFGILMDKETLRAAEESVFELKDKSVTDIGGSVKLTGHHVTLVTGGRYFVAEIDSEWITLRLGHVTYKVRYDACEEGLTEEELKSPRELTGPEVSKLYTLKEWKDAVSCGCSGCKEIPNDSSSHADIEWFKDGSFLCSVCWFSNCNSGY